MSDCALDPLDGIFPDDPNLPSLTYQASENVPIYVPWNCKHIALGTGFRTAVAATADRDGDPFCSTAFSHDSLARAKFHFIEDAGGNSFSQSSTSQSASSYEHVDFKFAVSAGGWALGASVSGPYAKTVLNNKDASKYSIRSTIRVGTITFTTLPSLSTQAFALLQQSAGLEAFRTKYGDYFVAGFRVGADNATFMSSATSADSRFEMAGIEVKGKFLGFQKVLYRRHYTESQADANYKITFSGFDTLDVFHQTIAATDAASYAQVTEAVERNINNGKSLQGRVRHRMEQVDLISSATLTGENCGMVCESGLVVELLLMPYAGLKESVAAAFCPKIG